MKKSSKNEHDFDADGIKENSNEDNNQTSPNIYTVREIKIEEVSIDGICGVY